MLIRLFWTYGRLVGVHNVRIEYCDTDPLGPFVTLAELDWPASSYADLNGTSNRWYRFIIVFTDGQESDPSSPKQLQPHDVLLFCGYVSRPDGIPRSYEHVYIATWQPPKVELGPARHHLMTVAPVVLKTELDGYFETELMKGSVVRFSCTNSALTFRFVVPDNVERLTLEDAMALPTAQFEK